MPTFPRTLPRLAGRRARRLTGLTGSAATVALVALVTGNSVGAAASPCFRATGHYQEHLAVDGCSSPVGLCIAIDYDGVVRGDGFGTATSFLSTIDSATTGVVAFTSDSVIHAQVHGRSGDLIVKNAGVFQQGGDGNIVDDQTIVGGTGELAGATGVLRASGTFSPVTGTGSSTYDGKVCFAP